MPSGETSWTAPRAGSPIRASVPLPGSKSLTNRLLLLAAIADSPSRISGMLHARDTLLMTDALRTMGVGIDDDGDGDGDVLVTPASLHSAEVETGLAGTVMRFVPPIAALADGPVVFDGDAYARERPMRALLDGLRQAGVDIDDAGTGRMPFTINGRGAVPGGRVQIDAGASSQFVSGLLLAAARYDKGIEIVHIGEGPVPSQPHLDMTLAVLRSAGVDTTETSPGAWRVTPGSIAGGNHVVEPDLSNAAPFLAAAMITGGAVHIPGWPGETTQPGDALRGVLARMGADVELNEEGLTVRGTGSITPLVADLRDVSELVTVIAALAAVADGPSHLTGLGHMRGHETDRLAALSTELGNLGCVVDEQADGLSITPGPLHGGTWHAYADHRMATAGAVLGLVTDDVEIDDIASTTKTLPDFPGMWNAMLAG